MDGIVVFVEGAATIAGVALLSLTVSLFFKCKKEMHEGIQKTDKAISSLIKTICKSNSTEEVLESICRLRRRKAHLNKDNQNYFSMFILTSLWLILIGILPASTNILTIIKSFLVWLAIICFVIGIYFIWRFFKELRVIDEEEQKMKKEE